VTIRNLNGTAKCGVLRRGKRVYITLEFEHEYAAMEAFDVFSMEKVDLSFKGPKLLVEAEETTPPDAGPARLP
jgi:hypothetical protein